MGDMPVQAPMERVFAFIVLKLVVSQTVVLQDLNWYELFMQMKNDNARLTVLDNQRTSL